MKHGKNRIALDWSRLLGFDQIRQHVPADSSLSDPRMTKLGSKVGSKGCSVRRDGALADSRMARLGAKVGSKPGTKTRTA